MPSHQHSPRSSHGGPAELGQNDLHDPRTIARIIDTVRPTAGPIAELGAGRGALTERLLTLHRPVTAVELDEHRVDLLRRRWPDLEVLHADATRLRLAPTARVVVGNLPFHVTTPLLRSILGAPHWQHAVLLVQWEVARKRAGVGGRTLLTAQTDPWFTVDLLQRVPSHAFRPRPSVDGGLVRWIRRTRPLIEPRERRAYERFVRDVFTGRGRGIVEILARTSGHRDLWRRACTDLGVDRNALPRDLAPDVWVGLWRIGRQHGTLGR